MGKSNQGTGFRHGICANTCNDIYHVCKDALFYYNPGSSHSQLTVCKKDTLICSKLNSIVQSANEFCEHIGLQINTKSSMDEDFVLKVIEGIPVKESEMIKNSMCHNLTSSYQLYGKSPVRLNRTIIELSSILAVKICLLISLVVVILVF